jgi:hypothetical protein
MKNNTIYIIIAVLLFLFKKKEPKWIIETDGPGEFDFPTIENDNEMIFHEDIYDQNNIRIITSQEEQELYERENDIDLRQVQTQISVTGGLKSSPEQFQEQIINHPPLQEYVRTANNLTKNTLQINQEESIISSFNNEIKQQILIKPLVKTIPIGIEKPTKKQFYTSKF